LGELILLFLALTGLIVVLGVFCAVSLLASVIFRSILPRCKPKLISLLGSALLPACSVLIFLLGILAALEPDFRGPEVAGIMIVGLVAAFSVMVGWPVSYFVTQRVIGNR
jgi:hypothetical protein